jgi:uncharacterized protein YjbI with pentapeptide repeats
MPADYSGQNLRGRSFKGQDLTGANFSGADIRSADFSGATLKGADFSGAKAGLRRRWRLFLIILILILVRVSEHMSGSIGSYISEIFSSDVATVATGWIVLIATSLFIIATIKKGIVSSLKVFSIFITLGMAISIALAVIFKAPVLGTTFLVGFTYAGANIIAIPIICIGSLVGAYYIGGKILFIIAAAFPLADVLNQTINLYHKPIPSIYAQVFPIVQLFTVLMTTVLMTLISTYIAWLVIKGDNKQTLIRNFAIAFAATGGTSFYQAKLIDANFTSAKLKNTDFRKAILTRTCFHTTHICESVITDTTYLQETELRQLLITGNGQGKNFENQTFQGLNLSQANLAYANLTNTNFYQSSLKEANLEGALLVRAQFESADLTNANLTGACIEDWVVTKTTKLYGVRCKYIFMKLTEGDKRDQMPLKGEFKNNDFVVFVESIRDTIKLYHERDVNPSLALYVLQSLSEDYQCTLEIIKIEKRGENGAIIEVKVPGNLNEEQLKETYYDKYQKSFNLYMTDPKKELKPSTNIENITLYKGFVIGGDVNNSTVADTINQGDATMTGDRNINTAGGNYNEQIKGSYVQGNYYVAGQPQSLAQAAAEIQQLLKQLEQTYPTTTTSQQMVVAAEAINRIENNPTMKQKVINAVKEGGLAAFEKAIDNPAGAFVVGAIKGWQEIEAKD